ncbi:MAG: hypothetical protein ACE5IY_15485 [bacterium]
MKTTKKSAVYKDIGKLQLESGEMQIWDKLDLPFGSKVEITIEYEPEDYLSGRNGVVWATTSLDQAETVQGALQAQKIAAEITEKPLAAGRLYCLRVTDSARIAESIDFVWRHEDGLNLRPDWTYPADQENASFAKWLRAI